METSELLMLRLLNQRLLEPMEGGPDDVVRMLGAVQAQDFAGSKWSIGLRLQDAVDGDVEKAFNEGSILRTHMLRPTWHFVTPSDIRAFLKLTAPRVQMICAGMYRKLELDGETLGRSMDVLEAALSGGRHLTRNELREVMRRNGLLPGDGTLPDDGRRMGCILMNGELEGLIVSGPRRGKQFTYALFDERVPSPNGFNRDDALAGLSMRYFQSRGPAAVYDYAKWSGLTVTDARKGIDAVRSHFLHETANGNEYWFPDPGRVGSGVPHGSGIIPAYFLSVYDEYVSGYRDYGPITDPGAAGKLFTLGNALTGIVVIAGKVSGVFTRTVRKEKVLISADLFRNHSREEKTAMDAAASRFGAHLGLPAVLNAVEELQDILDFRDLSD